MTYRLTYLCKTSSDEHFTFSRIVQDLEEDQSLKTSIVDFINSKEVVEMVLTDVRELEK